MKFKDFQAPVLFSSTFKALNLGEKNVSTSKYFQGRVGTMPQASKGTSETAGCSSLVSEHLKQRWTNFSTSKGYMKHPYVSSGPHRWNYAQWNGPNVTKPNPENCTNCSSKCAYDCAQLQYTIRHRTVMTISPVTSTKPRRKNGTCLSTRWKDKMIALPASTTADTARPHRKTATK